MFLMVAGTRTAADPDSTVAAGSGNTGDKVARLEGAADSRFAGLFPHNTEVAAVEHIHPHAPSLPEARSKCFAWYT